MTLRVFKLSNFDRHLTPFSFRAQEYAAGANLSEFLLNQDRPMSERLAVQLVLDPLMTALNHLQSKGIIHRDIKVGWCLHTCMQAARGSPEELPPIHSSRPRPLISS